MSSTDTQRDAGESVIQIRRCACVVKGGRRFSFAALVVTGDRNGRVGYGYGKAIEVPLAVEKATKAANRSMTPFSLVGTTIPHQVMGEFRASRILLLPAKPGTGVIAGECVRLVLEAAGISDILTKSYGSTNPLNLVKATFDALSQLQTKEEVARLRGVSLS
ncbi:MAG TPA: 30S ribosomal protein S5 [Planctomycetes bacterium]|nr:30S ribosomal protein S5 [Fuerstiella sp.]HIK91301.1 30S ribosomal protein S5 [Planctomycetota bacterium]